MHTVNSHRTLGEGVQAATTQTARKSSLSPVCMRTVRGVKPEQHQHRDRSAVSAPALAIAKWPARPLEYTHTVWPAASSSPAAVAGGSPAPASSALSSDSSWSGFHTSSPSSSTCRPRGVGTSQTPPCVLHGPLRNYSVGGGAAPSAHSCTHALHGINIARVCCTAGSGTPAWMAPGQRSAATGRCRRLQRRPPPPAATHHCRHWPCHCRQQAAACDAGAARLRPRGRQARRGMHGCGCLVRLRPSSTARHSCIRTHHHAVACDPVPVCAIRGSPCAPCPRSPAPRGRGLRPPAVRAAPSSCRGAAL